MANNPYINKVNYGGNTLIDLTGDDVTEADVLSGKKFHKPSGEQGTGTRADIGDPVAIAHGGTGATTAAGALAGLGAAAQSDLTDIIIDGNYTTHTGGAAIGEYVIVRNSTISGIADGLYKATQAIPANTAITSAYLAAVNGGGLNEVNEKIQGLIKTKNFTGRFTDGITSINASDVGASHIIMLSVYGINAFHTSLFAFGKENISNTTWTIFLPNVPSYTNYADFAINYIVLD